MDKLLIIAVLAVSLILVGCTQQNSNNDADCEKVKAGQKDDCLLALSNYKKDASFCDKIVNDLVHDQCLGLAQNYLNNSCEPCDKMRDSDQAEFCYKNCAGASSDPEICSKMQQETNKDICLLSMAVKNKNSAFCNGIKDDAFRNDCLDEISK